MLLLQPPPLPEMQSGAADHAGCSLLLLHLVALKPHLQSQEPIAAPRSLLGWRMKVPVQAPSAEGSVGAAFAASSAAAAAHPAVVVWQAERASLGT